MPTATDWLKIELDQHQVMSGISQQIENECAVLWTAAGMPASAALFTRKPDHAAKSRGIFTVLYFSPAMAHLCRGVIAAHFPVTTPRPPRQDTTVIIGGDPGLQLLD